MRGNLSWTSERHSTPQSDYAPKSGGKYILPRRGRLPRNADGLDRTSCSVLVVPHAVCIRLRRTPAAWMMMPVPRPAGFRQPPERGITGKPDGGVDRFLALSLKGQPQIRLRLIINSPRIAAGYHLPPKFRTGCPCRLLRAAPCPRPQCLPRCGSVSHGQRSKSSSKAA